MTAIGATFAPMLAPQCNRCAVAATGRVADGEETKGNSMRKLMIAAAAAVAAVALTGQGWAAPAAKDPLCAMGSQATNQSWQDHYHCWSGAMAKPVAAAPSKKDPLCSLAGTNQSWADHYGCWGPAKKY